MLSLSIDIIYNLYCYGTKCEGENKETTKEILVLQFDKRDPKMRKF